MASHSREYDLNNTDEENIFLVSDSKEDKTSGGSFNKFSAFLIFLFPALGGLLFGYDIGATSAVILQLQDEDYSGVHWHSLVSDSSALQGTITSMTMLGAVFGCLAGLKTADDLGRRRSILLAAVFYFLGSGLEWLSGVSSWDASQGISGAYHLRVRRWLCHAGSTCIYRRDGTSCYSWAVGVSEGGLHRAGHAAGLQYRLLVLQNLRRVAQCVWFGQSLGSGHVCRYVLLASLCTLAGQSAASGGGRAVTALRHSTALICAAAGVAGHRTDRHSAGHAGRTTQHARNLSQAPRTHRVACAGGRSRDGVLPADHRAALRAVLRRHHLRGHRRHHRGLHRHLPIQADRHAADHLHSGSIRAQEAAVHRLLPDVVCAHHAGSGLLLPLQ